MTINPFTNFKIRDPITGSSSYVNGTTASIDIESSSIISSYLLSEAIVIQPPENDPRFSTTVPTSIHLKGNQLSTVYLWLKSVTETINSSPILATIFVLPESPTAQIQIEGIIDNLELKQNMAKLKIQPSFGVDSFALSETQTSIPIFSSQNPTIAFFTQGINHTIYVWLKDKNNRQTSYEESIYTPPDTIVAHNPSFLFVDDNNQGITQHSIKIKLLNNEGDSILWQIDFNPVGKNFSRIEFNKTLKGYRIYIPENNLLSRHTATVNIANIFPHNMVIFRNGKRFHGASSHANRIIFEFDSLFGETRFEDSISDPENKMTIEIDDYDLCFAQNILKHNPTIIIDPGGIEDIQRNACPVLSEPIVIETALSSNELTFLTVFSQAEITFTEKTIDRLTEFDFPNKSVTFQQTVPIKETILAVKRQDDYTSDPNPTYKFVVFNPANNFAEFSIQIDTDPEFSSPTLLAFRIFENDNRNLVLDGLDSQYVSYFDPLAAPLGYGTIFWRVRRNGSNYTEPAILTIRTAQIFGLHFSVSSQFSAQIGTTAHVIAIATDQHNTPILGAKIEFTVEGSTNFSNTDISGRTSIDIEMPKIEKDFLITAQSESIVTTHTMTAIDAPHEESEISFDNIPAVVRYIIFRKEFAEIRSENENKILLISQTPNATTTKRDTTDFQSGVVFDPAHQNLLMARNTLPPKIVNDIHISNQNCYFNVSWTPTVPRSSTWFYDGKAQTNQNVNSENFSIQAPTGQKFDIISIGLANNSISPHPYETRGETFPAYSLERIDANFAEPITLQTSLTSTTDTNQNNGFDQLPLPVQNLTISTNNVLITLNWINPSEQIVKTGEFVYRVRAFDIGGNNSTSTIHEPPQQIQQCIDGGIITRINSTEYFTENRKTGILDSLTELAHGSVLPSSLTIYKLPEKIRLQNGTDYTLLSLGNENTGLRAKIIFNRIGILDPTDSISISYKYGRAIECGTKPTPHDFSIFHVFSGPEQSDSLQDTVTTKQPAYYTYGIWVRNISGQLSEGKFIQIAANP